MPSTPTHALRYPVLGDAPNVPLDIQRLAEDVERELTEMDALLITAQEEAPHYANVRPSATQNIANNSAVVITFGTNDGSNGMTVNLAAGTVTATKAGVYVVAASINFAANSTGVRTATILISDSSKAANAIGGFTGGYNVPAVAWTGYLAVGATVSLQATQTSGGTLATGPVDRTFLSVARVA